jgi:uncharacterized membrane protein
VIDFAFALAIHVLSVVLWIGGVAMVTTVILPAARLLDGATQQFAFFDAVERRFTRQARLLTLLAGASGLYMVHRLRLWPAFLDPAYWWLDAMVAVWLVFAAMLFVAEPLFFHRRLAARVKNDPERAFTLLARLHWALLILSLLTIAAAVAGGHGLSFFG